MPWPHFGGLIGGFGDPFNNRKFFSKHHETNLCLKPQQLIQRCSSVSSQRAPETSSWENGFRCKGRPGSACLSLDASSTGAGGQPEGPPQHFMLVTIKQPVFAFAILTHP